MSQTRIRRLALSGVLTALVFVVTAYLHIPTANGYIHVGDGFIYLAACLLPLPYAIAVGSGGALLADLLTGYAIWAPGSVVIKALCAVLFFGRRRCVICSYSCLALLPAAAVTAGGYYLYEALLYGNLIAPLAGIPASLLQASASAAVFVLLGLSVDRMRGNLKSR